MKTDENITPQGLTPNQIKRLELIRSSIINIQDSPEFNRMDYQPDMTLADAVYAIEELIDECNRNEPVKPVLRLTIRRRFCFTDFLSRFLNLFTLTFETWKLSKKSNKPDGGNEFKSFKAGDGDPN